MFSRFFILFGFLASLTLSAFPQDYHPPVDFKILLSGTFGELRGNHFHAGIDIKTRQKINMPIYASQEGYIKRIKVSSYGFGKALYINHPKGFTTVYAHLEKFSPEIQKRADEEHYMKEKFGMYNPLYSKKYQYSVPLKKMDLCAKANGKHNCSSDFLPLQGAGAGFWMSNTDDNNNLLICIVLFLVRRCVVFLSLLPEAYYYYYY